MAIDAGRLLAYVSHLRPFWGHTEVMYWIAHSSNRPELSSTLMSYVDGILPSMPNGGLWFLHQ